MTCFTLLIDPPTPGTYDGMPLLTSESSHAWTSDESEGADDWSEDDAEECFKKGGQEPEVDAQKAPTGLCVGLSRLLERS